MNARAIDAASSRRAAPHASARIDRMTLRDGREVVVRPVLGGDAQAEQAFVRALSVESRRKRFHVALNELSPALLRQMTEVDQVGHVAFVAAACADDDAPKIVADARYVHDGDETHFAIVVADAWQGVGLGRALLQRLLRHAARRGVTRLVGDILADNIAAARLVASFDGRFGASPQGPGVSRAHLELDPPVDTPATAALHSTRTKTMNDSPDTAPRRVALAALLTSLIAGCASVSPLPATLAPAAGEAPAMTLAADGVQIYECKAEGTPAWVLVAPDAELFDAAGRHVGHHGAGPRWQADDGSRIDGEVKSRAAARAADAIPWLLLSTRASGPQGAFSNVTSVQRINTVGGVAPSAPCDRDARGTVVRVPYRADYRLFVAREPANPSYAPY